MKLLTLENSASAAKDALGDKADENKHDAKADANKPIGSSNQV